MCASVHNRLRPKMGRKNQREGIRSKGWDSLEGEIIGSQVIAGLEITRERVIRSQPVVGLEITGERVSAAMVRVITRLMEGWSRSSLEKKISSLFKGHPWCSGAREEGWSGWRRVEALERAREREMRGEMKPRFGKVRERTRGENEISKYKEGRTKSSLLLLMGGHWEGCCKDDSYGWLYPGHD